MKSLLLVSVFISFFVTFIFLNLWIKKLREIGFLWKDMNKYESRADVVSSGGLIVVLGFILGVLYYIAIRTFLIGNDITITLQIFAILSVVLICAIIGFVDDFLGWERGGLPRTFRILLTFIASIPLVVINAGSSSMSFPFLGEFNFGILYPLFIIPIGIAGATTTYNFLAGFNGLEAGQGILILSFLSFVAYYTGSPWLALIGVIMVGALIAFYFYNKFPSKVFPGDILTYSVGALIATMAILGNFQKVAIFVFIPYITEVILKLRGKLVKQSFAKPNKDNSLEMPYDKIYGMTHLSLFILKKFKNKVYEKDVVYFIFAIQIIFIIIGIFMVV